MLSSALRVEVRHSKRTDLIYFTATPTAEPNYQFRIPQAIKHNPLRNSGMTHQQVLKKMKKNNYKQVLKK